MTHFNTPPERSYNGLVQAVLIEALDGGAAADETNLSIAGLSVHAWLEAAKQALCTDGWQDDDADLIGIYTLLRYELEQQPKLG